RARCWPPGFRCRYVPQNLAVESVQARPFESLCRARQVACASAPPISRRSRPRTGEQGGRACKQRESADEGADPEHSRCVLQVDIAFAGGHDYALKRRIHFERTQLETVET